MSANALPLRDIHPDVAPPWWPPAPGWWLLLAAAVLLAAVIAAWRWREHRRRRALAWVFDQALAAAAHPAAEVAAMSELLRRAARRVRADADRLTDAQWRAMLAEAGGKDDKLPALSAVELDLLLEGGYRREVDADAVAALRPWVRRRFMAWMGART